jgi:DNA-binding GntR family transcriptional regulator
MTDEDVAEIRSIGHRLQEAAHSGDRRAVAIIDASLHERIIELSGNQTLLRVWRSLEPLSRTYITLAGPGGDPQWSADLHDPILESIDRRDTEGVVRAIESHFDEVRVWLAAHLAEQVGDDHLEPGASTATRDR